MIFDDIDRKIRTLEARMHWIEEHVSAYHESHRNALEKLHTLHDEFEQFKSLQHKQKAK